MQIQEASNVLFNVSRFEFKIKYKTVADPEFPRGGALTPKRVGVLT